MSDTARQFAVVTGASSGIGLELAREFAENGFDLLLCADRSLAEAEQALGATGARVQTLEADLSTQEGVGRLCEAIKASGRPVDALAANAGVGHGQGFLDQDPADWLKIINTNVEGTLGLIYVVGRDMRSAGHGRILITSSIASQMPGTYQAVYNASKAFLQSFSFALRQELKDTGVTVTALLPGATETDFFERGELEDTKVGQAKKDDPAMVAKAGFEGLMKGEGDVTAGLKNKLQVLAARFLPETALAKMHEGMAAPGSGES